MTRQSFLLFALLPWLAAAGAESLPTVSSGRIERLDHFASAFVDARNIDVWLPNGYTPAQRYRVLYMHDGQALFSGSASVSGKSWSVADTVARLMNGGRLEPLIVVAIWNDGAYRLSEYFPEKALQFMNEAARRSFIDESLAGRPRADRYLRFLVEELKPTIDRRYATLSDRDNTLIMGSSMGAVISLYALSEYPEVFGAAACLSTHWLGRLDNNATIPLATFDYLRDHIPDPARHRIYMDHGTLGLDALYPVHQQFFDLMAHDSGYSDRNYQSRVFPGAAHDEAAWAARLEAPLVFLAGRFNRAL